MLKLRQTPTAASSHAAAVSRRARIRSCGWLGGLIGTFLVVLSVLAIPAPATAQQYPTRPIRIVVGFAPGGGVDIAARTIGKYLTESLGQGVVVDNRPGASGNIAAELVATSPPDGYTLLMGNVTLAMPGMFNDLHYDIRKDLTPVSLVARGAHVLVVNSSVPASNIRELIELAKAKPGHLKYASGGYGNINHLEMEWFNLLAGVKIAHIPYKGAAPSVLGLLSGESQILMTSIPSVTSHIASGKVRPLAMSTSERSRLMPDIPTLEEAGLSGYDAYSWYGLFAPSGVPADVLERLDKELVRIMQIPDVKAAFATEAFEPVGNSSQEFAQFMDSELAKWDKLIKATGIKVE